MDQADQHLELLLNSVLLEALAVTILGVGVAAAIVGLRTLAARRRVYEPRTLDTSRSRERPEHVVLAPVTQLGSIDRLATLLDRSRRLAIAEERVGRELGGASPTGWMVERNVLVGTQRVPFVVIGPSGLFLLCATDGAWTMHDLDVLAAAGEDLRCSLPDYRGPTAAVVCLAFDDSEPRSWHGPLRSGCGGWVVGLDQLWPWLEACSSQYGISRADVVRLHTAAGPHWQRRAVPRLPLVRNLG